METAPASSLQTAAREPEVLRIEGARQNNLRNLTLDIPHDRVTVITGVSGSGKSSLAFDTLFAEGQWRYIESLSAYARMFLEKVDRPAVDAIHQIRPAIAIEQKNPVRTARSTVGTATELYDYLRLLYAKIGLLECPGCGQPVRGHSPTEVAQLLLQAHGGSRAYVLFPLDRKTSAQALLQKGFVRILVKGEPLRLEPGMRLPAKEGYVVVDRLSLEPESASRLAEAVETAYQQAGGVQVQVVDGPLLAFGPGFRCQRCQRDFETPQPLLFSFNHPLGACPECKGFGNVLHYAEERIVPDPTRSLAEGAIEPWTKPAYAWWQEQMLEAAPRLGIDVHTPWSRLPKKAKTLLYKGGSGFYGIEDFFEELEEKRYKLHVRVFLSRYRAARTCPACQGTRLKPEALWVKVGGMDIARLCRMTVAEMARWFQALSLDGFQQAVAQDLLEQIHLKLGFLLRVGLGYLTVDRQTRTLSGGEAQRINLANQLSSRLVGTLYVLDEPSIGLHARDVNRLVSIVQDLARVGNTVVVVEHDRSFMEAADFLVELGPGGGDHGGRLVFTGTRDAFHRAETLTARYLRGERSIPMPSSRRPGMGRSLVLRGACTNNLKHVDVRIPLGTFTCITGVSGSGKSSLVTDTLYPALARALGQAFLPGGSYEALEGVEWVKGVRLIDQEPIGRTPRSNPVTYLKAFDVIRRIFAQEPEARMLGLTPSHFSFNVAGGRCEKCQGSGYERLEMVLFEDLYVTCEACQGRRYQPQVLRVTYRGHRIDEVLGMTVEEALRLFRQEAALVRSLQVLADLGMGYLRLGQPATTLSGGEAQRLKIAAELTGRTARDWVYILDEPTTGLHWEDVRKLLRVLGRLVDEGNTVVVVEHHLDVIKCADWIVDLGPEGGDAGGEVVVQGTPEDVARAERSHTGRYLRSVMT